MRPAPRGSEGLAERPEAWAEEAAAHPDEPVGHVPDYRRPRPAAARTRARHCAWKYRKSALPGTGPSYLAWNCSPRILSIVVISSAEITLRFTSNKRDTAGPPFSTHHTGSGSVALRKLEAAAEPAVAEPGAVPQQVQAAAGVGGARNRAAKGG